MDLLSPAPLRFLLLTSVSALLCADAAAQVVGGRWDTVNRFNGANAGDRFGLHLAAAGDMNADGIEDMIIGAPRADPGGRTCAGTVYVYSGATHQVLRQFDGLTPWDALGRCVFGAGDVDGDGAGDLIVGATGADPGGNPEAGSAYVFSGATGALLHQFDGEEAGDHLGEFVDGAGDVDGDGFGDLIVGAKDANPGGRISAGSVYVYSGATGDVIWRFDGDEPGDWMGRCVAGMGDVDGDGVPDLAANARFTDPGGLTDAGSVYVYSGATGQLLWRVDGAGSGYQFGKSLARLEDIDGDGSPDMVVGAFGANPNGLFQAGAALVLSGATGAVIWRFDGENIMDQLGYSVSGADIDGDGIDDILVGTNHASPGGRDGAGAAYIYNGATGEQMVRFEGRYKGDRLGACVAGIGDQDGDGLETALVAARWADPNGLTDAGSAFLYGLDPMLHPASRELSISTAAPVDLDLDFPLDDAELGYMILASMAGTGPTVEGTLSVPLTADKLYSRLRSGSETRLFQYGVGFLDANGDAQDALLANDPRLALHVGKTIYLAAVSFERKRNGGGTSSIARQVTIVP